MVDPAAFFKIYLRRSQPIGGIGLHESWIDSLSMLCINKLPPGEIPPRSSRYGLIGTSPYINLKLGNVPIYPHLPWIPAFARVPLFSAFYESINIGEAQKTGIHA